MSSNVNFPFRLCAYLIESFFFLISACSGVSLFFLKLDDLNLLASCLFWKKLYGIVPPLLFCYLIPGFLNSYHIIDGEASGLYSFATKYLLPASLILLLSTANLKAIFDEATTLKLDYVAEENQGKELSAFFDKVMEESVLA